MNDASGQTERFSFLHPLLHQLYSNKRAPTNATGQIRGKFGKIRDDPIVWPSSQASQAMETKQAAPDSTRNPAHTPVMAETSSSEEDTSPLSSARPSPEPPTTVETAGKKELETRTKAVEEALCPLIEQVRSNMPIKQRWKEAVHCSAASLASQLASSPTPSF